MGVVRFGCSHFTRHSATLDCSRKVEPESTFGETQPDVTAAEGCGDQSQLEIRLIRVVNSAVREDKDVTRMRGRQVKLDFTVGFPTHFKKDERKRERAAVVE